jgi:hypothetical protein
MLKRLGSLVSQLFLLRKSGFFEKFFFSSAIFSGIVIRLEKGCYHHELYKVQEKDISA